MSTTWKDVDVQCPFYLSSDSGLKTGYVVRCEGVTEGGKLCHRFKREKHMADFMSTYCNDGYIRCPIYRMLMEFYDD